jgi:hypothetical protein
LRNSYEFEKTAVRVWKLDFEFRNFCEFEKTPVRVKRLDYALRNSCEFGNWTLILENSLESPVILRKLLCEFGNWTFS